MYKNKTSDNLKPEVSTLQTLNLSGRGCQRPNMYIRTNITRTVNLEPSAHQNQHPHDRLEQLNELEARVYSLRERAATHASNGRLKLDALSAVERCIAETGALGLGLGA
jgi:hypothetical protein